MRELRYAAMTLFGILFCLPMIFVFPPPRPLPIAYPPYYPPSIQAAAGWAKEKELIMSDIPWAMAWYGQSQCVWLTLNAQSDFLAINDYQKPIQEVFLTRVTMDSRFLTGWVLAGDQNWGSFILDCLVRKMQRQPSPAPTFPLHYWQAGWPEQFLLTSREHWPKAL